MRNKEVRNSRDREKRANALEQEDIPRRRKDSRDMQRDHELMFAHCESTLRLALRICLCARCREKSANERTTSMEPQLGACCVPDCSLVTRFPWLNASSDIYQ